MKIKLMISSLFALLFLVGAAHAAVEPVISKNVHVLRNVTASQCPASWMGNPGTATLDADTAGGVIDSVASGVRSCTGCAFDQASSDCVCETCYDNYD